MYHRADESTVSQFVISMQAVGCFKRKTMTLLALRLFLLLALAFAIHTVRAEDPAKPSKEESEQKDDPAKDNPGKENTNKKESSDPKDGKPEKADRPNANKENNGAGRKTDSELKAEFREKSDALQKRSKDLLGQLKNASAEER